MTVADLQDVMEITLIGESLTDNVERLGCYTVNVRYLRSFRSIPRSVTSEVTAQLKAVIPLTLLIVFLPHYLNFRRMSDRGEDRIEDEARTGVECRADTAAPNRTNRC